MNTAGVCKIKAEFILPEHKLEVNLECISEKDKRKLNEISEVNTEKNEEPPNKQQKLTRSEKKKLRGQNKSRGPTFRYDRTKELCKSLINTTSGNITQCTIKNCQAIHDIQEYLKIKPSDIGDFCYNFNISGNCSRGLACRFGSQHIVDGFNVIDKEKYKSYTESDPKTLNNLSQELIIMLRKKKYDFKISENLVKYNDGLKKILNNENEIERNDSQKTSGTVTDEDVIRLLQREKKTIDFRDKIFLSPLTTVGNLPFRRICKEFGVDVTCGEMAMCSSLLQGSRPEWALVKRHHTENIFGVQLCANNPYLLTKCGQFLDKEMQLDFVDLNLGCPIDLVYREGGGCGLLRRPKVLESCIRSLSQILTIPLTVKTRIGVYNNENIAHTLIPKFRDWGASLVTVHGRSKEQRYTKNADWEYIRKCAETVTPFPVIGNGDILNYEDYKTVRENYPELAGIMIGRGALIKPWIFTEIKEQKLWDISSRERLDVLKKYVNYGLEHWGSDNDGVENTRRFLLEWLSFLYRYVPVGLLESPPQKINERPPYYKGRDELETLMASPSASDWIKISEMLLGPVPDNFQFLPKHKANSYK